MFGGHGAAGRYTCDCALCDKWLNADVVQNYRAVSAGWLGGPSALTGAMHLEGARLTNTRLLPAKGCRAPLEDQQLIRNYPASSLLFCSPSSSTRYSLLLSPLSHPVSISSLLLNFPPLSFLFSFGGFVLSIYHIFISFWLFPPELFSFVPPCSLLFVFFNPHSSFFSCFIFIILFLSFLSFQLLRYSSLPSPSLHPMSVSSLPPLFYSRNLCSVSFLFFSFHLASSSVFCSSSLLFVTPTSSNLFQMFL